MVVLRPLPPSPPPPPAGLQRVPLRAFWSDVADDPLLAGDALDDTQIRRGNPTQHLPALLANAAGAQRRGNGG